MIIPIMTFFMYSSLLVNNPILRDCIIFVYLSFIPGFALLKLFKLNETSFLDITLLSVGLSIAFLMFSGVLVNELYVILGLSQSLSVIPLTVTISVFTLVIFFIDYKRDLSETFEYASLTSGLKDVFPVSIILFLLPIASALGVLYQNVPVILLSCVVIAVLCVASFVSKRLVPESLFPFLIFSISIALVCQVLLTSPHIVGADANLEYYIFRLTQISGHWGFLNANVNPLVTLNYNSMLSITVLPAIYSTLMNAQGEIVFKILYPFIICLIPLVLYRTFEKQFGKLIGLLSTLFFVFTSLAFYDFEILSLNRQIVGEFFLVISVFLFLNKEIPVTKRRALLIVFGFALAVSHYSLAFMYLAFVAVIYIVSRFKPKIDSAFNFVTVLLLFVITFAWYSIASNSLLNTLENTIVYTINQALVLGQSSHHIGVATTMYSLPEVFTAATWTNVAMLFISYFFLAMGIIVMVLRPKGTGISAEYRVLSIAASIILAVAAIVPSVAIILNFSRFYAITLLFLSPCFVFGGLTVLASMKKAWMKVKRPLRRKLGSKSKNINIVLLLIAIILSAYFLSQDGFVNRVTGTSIHSYNLDFDRMMNSNESQVKMTLYGAYIPEQDVSSAIWLLNYRPGTTTVYADFLSSARVLISYGLMPQGLMLPLTNLTIPGQSTFIYLSSLNVINGVISTNFASTGTLDSFNTSETSPLLNKSDLIYSNGASEIWSFSR
jgi:uncharacterized membrane protein